MISLRLVALLALVGCGGHWSRANSALEASYVAANLVDWRQTNEGIAILGADENPAINMTSPAVYFPVTLVAHAAISAALPPRWREAWQAVTLCVEVEVVRENVGALAALRRQP